MNGVENNACIVNMYTSYFTNNIVFENFNKLVCIAGHTHHSYDFVNGNIRYIANKYGYENEPTNVNLNCIFDV